MNGFQTTTFVFKTISGISLTIDISIPPNAPNNSLVILHLHGGFLVLGEKTTFPPHWLINACRTRGWTYATASYRLLPEASGTEVLSDTVDACQWVHENISNRIIVAGSSAGGYLGLATVAHPNCPPILALLSIYGMLDPLSERYIQPGRPLRAPMADLPAVLEKLDKAIGSNSIIDGYPFPGDIATDVRFGYIRAMHEAARYPDILTRTPGLASEVLARGIIAVPDECKVLFPVSFGLKRDFPPTILLHGDSDILVDCAQSISLAAKMNSLGINVQLEIVEGHGHGFETKDNIDVYSEDVEDENKSMKQALRRVVDKLEVISSV